MRHIHCIHRKETRTRHRALQRVLAMVGMAACLSVSLACGSDTTGPSSDRIKDGYWELQLNHHAITLSLTGPGNQLQLQAVPLTVNGDTILTTSKVQYMTTDSSVIVDSTGLLTAKHTRSSVNIIARLTIPNGTGQAGTLTDTAVVNVNAAPSPIPVFTALQITTPGDSATFGPVAGMTGITVTALDASNTPMNAVNVYCQSSNSNVVDYGRGKVNSFTLSSYAHLPGTTTVTCSATIYGVSLSDSLPIHIGLPLYSKILVDTQLVVSGSPNVIVSTNVVKIGVGGVIQWDNHSNRTVDLVFDDSAALSSVPASERVRGSGILGIQCVQAVRCKLPTGTGNVLLQPATNAFFTDGKGRDFRKFLTAGTYPYHSATYPTLIGTIVVQ